MDKRHQKLAKATTNDFEEVTSVEWKIINMTEEEEDLIYRMHKLVGDKWALIAGRVPGRKPEEIERFWIMRHIEGLAERKKGIQSQYGSLGNLFCSHEKQSEIAPKPGLINPMKPHALRVSPIYKTTNVKFHKIG